jgi:hypothetical protein
VTSSVRCSADAGMVAGPSAARATPTDTTTMRSLRTCMRRGDPRLPARASRATSTASPRPAGWFRRSLWGRWWRRWWGS